MLEDDEEVPDLVLAPSDITKKVPVTILTGFLGAGKTTLLTHILTASHGKRIAVIENEFSSGLGIEGMIAKSGVDGASLNGFFELNNGCICCSVKDSLLSTLEQLVLHKDKFDYIIIETTGVANPGPIISTFWADDGMDSCLKLDGVVCVVDSFHIERNLSDASISRDVSMQISYADRILLNKSDTVSSQQMQVVQNCVQELNSIAEVKITSFSNVDVNWVLDLDCYCAKTSSVESLVELCAPCVSVSNSHAAVSLATESFKFPGRVSIPLLERYLDNVLYGQKAAEHSKSTDMAVVDMTGPITRPEIDSPSSIFRMKGILHSTDSAELLILQAVHDVFDIQPSSHLVGGENDRTDNQNLVIVIGRNLNRDELLRGFMSCCS